MASEDESKDGQKKLVQFFDEMPERCPDCGRFMKSHETNLYSEKAKCSKCGVTVYVR